MATKRSTGKSKNLDPRHIERNPENPRLIFRQDEMDNLMFSIDRHGIQVPLTVYEDGDVYRLIDGERRWRCATKLNLRSVPVLVQDKPTELENLLLMYNIHALREQWDYFTIASKLTRVIELYEEENGHEPNEIQLSEETGLTRGQIRRCRLLLDLPERFKDMLLQELELPKLQQKLSEDLFIEMEKSLKTVTNRLPDYSDRIDGIRDALIAKFRDGLIPAVTDFRQLSKIATAVKNIGLQRDDAVESLDAVFDPKAKTGIREAYEQTVELGYDEKDAARRLQSLTNFLDRILEEDQLELLDDEQAGPVRFQGVPVHDVRRFLQWDACVGLPEFQAQPVVHDVIHHPQRGLRNAGWKLAKLDSVELVHVHDGVPCSIQHDLSGFGGRVPNLPDYLDLEQPQLPLGDDKKVAAAAGRIEERQFTELSVKPPKLAQTSAVLARLQPL